MSAEIEHLVTAARAAAHEAAGYLRGIDRSDVDREYKRGAQDIVTVHDKRAEEIIRASLTAAAPDATIVGEEGGVSEGCSGATFYVDPIDGTSNFAAGLPLFAVSIGVAINDALVGGVINAPVLGQEFWSDHSGAYLGERKIGPRNTKPTRDALVLTSFPSWKDLREHPEFALDALGTLKRRTGAIRSLGTAALELAYVAAGWADAGMLSKIAPWDVAAGFHLVEAAGGSLRTWSGRPGDPADRPSIPPQLCPAYVACTGQSRIDVLDSIQDTIHSMRAQEGASS